MADEIKIVAPTWKEYELIDSGEGEKLERFGDHLLIREEPGAWWQKSAPKGEWTKAEAVHKGGIKAGEWKVKRGLPKEWPLEWGGVKFLIKLSISSNHIGVFPEEAEKWRWIKEAVTASKKPVRVLNLFGYTGASTLASATAGQATASGNVAITHLDASSPAIQWAKENQKLSGLEKAPIRWILDDALKFVKREARRGVKYDAIILDPPVFGRGPKGEIWKIKENLVPLLYACKEVLSAAPIFIIITIYGLGESSIFLKNLIADITKGGILENGEFCLKPKFGEKILPLSSFCIWKAGM